LHAAGAPLDSPQLTTCDSPRARAGRRGRGVDRADSGGNDQCHLPRAEPVHQRGEQAAHPPFPRRCGAASEPGARGRQFVLVRVFGEADALFSRGDEQRIFAAVARAGLGPRLLARARAALRPPAGAAAALTRGPRGRRASPTGAWRSSCSTRALVRRRCARRRSRCAWRRPWRASTSASSPPRRAPSRARRSSGRACAPGRVRSPASTRPRSWLSCASPPCSQRRGAPGGGPGPRGLWLRAPAAAHCPVVRLPRKGLAPGKLPARGPGRPSRMAGALVGTAARRPAGHNGPGGAGGRPGGRPERRRRRAAGLLPQRPAGAPLHGCCCRRTRSRLRPLQPARAPAQYGNMLLHTSAPRSLSGGRPGRAAAHAVAMADRAVRGGSPPARCGSYGSAWGGSPRGWSPEPAGCARCGDPALCLVGPGLLGGRRQAPASRAAPQAGARVTGRRRGGGRRGGASAASRRASWSRARPRASWLLTCWRARPPSWAPGPAAAPAAATPATRPAAAGGAPSARGSPCA